MESENLFLRPWKVMENKQNLAKSWKVMENKENKVSGLCFHGPRHSKDTPGGDHENCAPA